MSQGSVKLTASAEAGRIPTADLDLKVISPTLFAMLVLMAMVTTFATTPILDALNRDAWRQEALVPESPLPTG
jgi:hypothetical protein